MLAGVFCSTMRDRIKKALYSLVLTFSLPNKAFNISRSNWSGANNSPLIPGFGSIRFPFSSLTIN